MFDAHGGKFGGRVLQGNVHPDKENLGTPTQCSEGRFLQSVAAQEFLIV